MHTETIRASTGGLLLRGLDGGYFDARFGPDLQALHEGFLQPQVYLNLRETAFSSRWRRYYSDASDGKGKLIMDLKSTWPSPSGASSQPRHYSLGPFLLRSEFELPELAGWGTLSEHAGRPVAIRRAKVERVLPGGVAYDAFCSVSARQYLLSIPKVASYLVSDGSDVAVEVEEGAPAAEVRAYLYGSVFGALCHGNGLLPLHASAVESASGVTAFLGESGAGKSTLAACLRQRGMLIVADDICLLDSRVDPPRVVPVARWLKLSEGSLHHLQEEVVPTNRVFLSDNKYRMYLPEERRETLSLRNLVFLDRAASASSAPELRSLSGPDAVARTMGMTYLRYVPELTGGDARLFEQCARLVSSARAFLLTVPPGLERMDEVMNLLEERLLA